MCTGGATLDGKDGQPIKSVNEMVLRFSQDLLAAIPDWKARLRDDPDELEELERDVHAACARGADFVVAGLVSVISMESDFHQVCDQTRGSFAYPLTRGRERKLRVRLLGGLVMWVFTLYCQPRRRWFDNHDEKKPGIYSAAAQFGFGKGVTPGLQSRVARQAALCPSFDFAHEELARSGLDLDIKTVRRISYQCGEGLLRLRRHYLEQWRSGKLPAGGELKGERVTVQIDGGRTKLRGKLKPAPARKENLNDDGLVVEDAPGRSKKRAKRSYSSEWKEPKLLTIFVHDEHGKMVKKSQATIDGTMLGPDAVAELVAMHLHRLGAAEANSITFVADGAPWIWDRIPIILKRLKPSSDVELHEVLDNCHAAHHVSLALAALGLSDKERMPLYREHRTLLRNGQWRRVVEELRGLASSEPKDSAIHTEIAYLEKHGKAGRLSYRHFRTIGIPLGSGAIESTIRRVINQRLKGNGLSWYRANAEAMLQLRAQVVSKRWDDQLKAMRAYTRQDARTDWTWDPQSMSIKDESNLTTSV